MNDEPNETPRKGSPRIAQDAIPKQVRKKPSLGEILQSARAESGLTVRQVAAQTGISTGTVSSVEQGTSLKPTLDNLLGLADVYGIDPMQLIEAAGYKLKKPALPDFKPYLRQKYRHLPKDAKDEITDAFQRITEKYGISHQVGPASGEDEDDYQTSTDPQRGGRNSEH